MMKYAVIGSRTSLSLSPLLNNWIYSSIGFNAKYSFYEINNNQINDIIIKLRNNEINGINITYPYKEEVSKYIDEYETITQSIGSVNCIKSLNGKIIGYNTDYYGFASSILYNNIKLNSNSILVLGAGGASRAICKYLNDMKINFLIYNRTIDNSKRMMSSLGINNPKYITSSLIGKKLNTIINCISSDVDSFDLLSSIKYDFDFLDTFVDLNYNTELNSELPKSSRYISGIDMLIFQALKSNEIWMGRDISSEIDFNILKEFIRGK